MWTKQNIKAQNGKTVIVTGANAGLGYETALGLYEAGADVVLACRSQKTASEAVASITKSGGKGSLKTAILDLSSLDSVKQFAVDFKNNYQKLDVLINNAGIMTPPAALTADGYESQFGVNFLGHFALTGYLYPLLQTTPDSRIVTLSSLAYTVATIDFDNLKLEKPYDAHREYFQSKLANMVFTVELQRRISAHGDQILSLGAHPGVAHSTISRHMDQDVYDAALEKMGPLMETAQGALPTLYAAVAENVEETGFYGPDEPDGLRGYPTKITILDNALDKELGKKLWETAEEMTGLVFP